VTKQKALVNDASKIQNVTLSCSANVQRAYSTRILKLSNGILQLLLTRYLTGHA